MKRLLILTLIAAFAATRAAAEPDSLKSWTLNDCLDYALEHNIQLRQSRNDYLSGIEDTKEARAALFPSLTASTSQGLTNYPSSNATDRNSYTGTYGLEAGMTLYNGGKLRTAVKRQQVQNRIDELAVDEAANDIRIAIVRAYMQCLYAAEAVTVNRSTADASKAQRDRAEAMWKAGSISRVDFAQLESQYASDEYQVVVAQSSLDSYRLQLKHLLELDISDEITLAEPSVDEEAILAQLLFISLVENAFKHGVSYEKPSYITIDIHEMEDQLLCSIKNSSFPKSDSDRSGSGIGLQNLSKRLEMIYPGRYIFEYGPAGEADYRALLCIKFTDR